MRRQTIKTYLIKLIATLGQPGRSLTLLVKAYRLWQIGGTTAIALRLKEFKQRPLDQAELWQQYRHTLSRTTFSRVTQRLSDASPPRLTIGLILHSPSAEGFSQAMQSVIEQIYPHWELWMVADAVLSSTQQQVLKAWARQDQRIQGQCSQKVADLAASGAFTLLISDNCLLEKQALLRIAEALVADQPDLIYADEAVVADGMTLQALILRPAFSLEYLRCNPAIAQPLGFSAKLLQAIGSELAGPVDPDDLMRRAVKQAHCIVHIPEILYLKRAASDLGRDRQQLSPALTNDFTRSGAVNVNLNEQPFHFFEPPYSLQPNLRVAIIIPSRNCGQLVKTCIESIKSTVKSVAYDIVLVDHASDDPDALAYFQTIADHGQVLRYDGAFNFSAINNWAIAQLTDRYSHYLFCNNDIEAIEAGWLERMLMLAQQPDVGIVGAKLLYPDRLIQHAGIVIGLKGASAHLAHFLPAQQADRSPTPGYLGALVVNREVSAVTAACLLMRRDAFVAVQGYDEGFVVGFGDTDLCLRVQQAGYRVIFCGPATLIHHESYTRGKSDGERDPHPADSARFIARWKDLIKTGDPYYNPNLSHFSYDWAVQSPLTINDPIHRRIYRPRSPLPRH